jgi:hypothetical protein
VREELKTKGALGSEEHTLKVLIPRQEMTGAERQWASQYEPGDVIRYTRGSKHMGIEAGSYATVVRVNQFSNEISVEQSSGNIVAYDARRLAGITV